MNSESIFTTKQEENDYISFCRKRGIHKEEISRDKYEREIKRWERKGSCKRCGKCCTARGLLKSKLLDIKHEDPVGKINKMLNSDDEELKKLIKMVMAWKCPDLVKTIKRNKALYSCAVHETLKPDFCREYPEIPGDLIPGCGYYFVEKGDQDGNEG